MWGAAEIGALVITCGSVLTALIAQIQLSRCKKINLCYGCCACTRDLSEVEDPNKITPMNELASIHDELESLHDIMEDKDKESRDSIDNRENREKENTDTETSSNTLIENR
jgi:carbonic anhydrase